MVRSYTRELNRNYLVLEEEEYRETYQTGMLLKNRIPGFLECRMSRIDGKVFFYYEITSRQSLRLILERKKLSVSELMGLLEGIGKAVRSCEEYLLSTEGLILTPDCIYLDPDEWSVFFCFFPFADRTGGNGLPELAEYLLDYLDRQDSDAVTLGYEFYRMTGEENPSIPEFLEKWKEELGGQKRSKEQSEAEETKAPEEPQKPEEKPEGGTICLTRSREQGLLLRSETRGCPDFRITKESFLLGKKKDAVDGWLKVRGVSRIHGRISKEEEGYYLTDLNSTNGTFLNGARLEVNEKVRLHTGDRIGFADVRYSVEE